MTAHTTLTRPAKPVHTPINIVRGFLVGLAELVPGVSGGTLALVLGVYERALLSVTALGRAVKVLVRGPSRAEGFRTNMREVEWWLVVPALAGMAAAVLFAAGPVSALVEAHPENARGLFFGLVAVSLVVPIRMLPAGGGGASRIVIGALAVVVSAVVSFVLVGFASNSDIEHPQWWFVLLAAAVAVCALVVPGVSGSFFLLAVGLYHPTLEAVDGRDLGYIGVFALGAVIGLLTVVRGITYLLSTHRFGTLLVMLGLMLGSLRALWPWQGGPGGADGHGTLLAPTDPAGPILWAVFGAVLVGALIIAESVAGRRAR